MAGQGTVMPAPKYTAYDNNGDPLSGGKLYVYEAGTLTPKTTYTDVDLLVPNTNPVILDSGGRATVFLAAGSYKFIQKDASDVIVFSQDNVSSVAPFNVDVDVLGIAGENIAAGDAVYLSSGAIGTAGRWYKTNAAVTGTSTEAITLGMAPDLILAGAIGQIRLLGSITLVGPLVPGAAYYLSDTPGGVNTVPGTNTRFMGQAEDPTTLIIAPNQGGIIGGGGGGAGLDYLQLQVFG